MSDVGLHAIAQKRRLFLWEKSVFIGLLSF